MKKNSGNLRHENTSKIESLCQLNFVAIDKDGPIVSYLCACYICLNSSPKQGNVLILTFLCSFYFLMLQQHG